MELQAVPTRRWTRSAYARMVETGIIQPDEKVELLTAPGAALSVSDMLPPPDLHVR